MKKNNENNKNIILLSHGDGGIKTQELITKTVLKYLGNSILQKLEDSAILNCSFKKIAFTTDSFVVKPVFFPGGDIGKLSVCGTINDLVTTGCKPDALSFSLILEEGFEIKKLEKILYSIRKTIDSSGSGIKIVTGDTKVVEKGSADGIFINTTGIGFIDKFIELSPHRIMPGDLIIINGPIADHGIAVLGCREGFDFKTNIKSDCAPLNLLVSEVLEISNRVHALRDATRGGLARVLLEIAQSTKMDFEIYQDAIPVKKQTRAVCEFLGMDPLYIANEGKMVFFVDPKDSDKVVQAMKQNKFGKSSKIIGRVTKKNTGSVTLITGIGTKRMLNLYYSEQLPRIC